MKRLGWKWLLPLLQLALALAASVYGPHQYRVKARERGVVGDNNVLEYFSQNFPVPIERISKGINFPAWVLGYPLRENDNAIFFRNTDYTLIWISYRELGFFAGIVVFWYWVGQKLDQSQGRCSRITWPRALRIAGLTAGFLFAILAGAYALQMTTSGWHPDRQIGAFGIAWSLALIAYFAWRTARRETARSLTRKS